MVGATITTTTIAGAQSKRSFASTALHILRLVVVNFVIFAVLAELGSLAFVHWKKWPSSRPNYRLTYNGFDADINPAFGRWHRPNSRFLHQGSCFSVEYTSNSYGARDVERSLHSAQPRTIVLGDSYMEGYGLPDEQRVSNLLEQRTGQEYLNFASAATSPLQYALVYRTMAAAFDHKHVLVGVFTGNDFHEMDRGWLDEHYHGEYRPYYNSDLSVGYLGKFQPNAPEGFWDHVEAVARAYLASYHVSQYVYNRALYWRMRGDYSGYNDYSDVDLARLKKALLDIKSTADAHGATESVFLIPTPADFERLHRSRSNRLGPTMESWGQEVGIPVKDLMPAMDARANGDLRDLYFTCTCHWTARGASVVADILQPWIYGN